MTRYAITETTTYHVDANSPEEAMEKVFNTDDGMLRHFYAVNNRELEDRDRPGTVIPEPEMGW